VAYYGDAASIGERDASVASHLAELIESRA